MNKDLVFLKIAEDLAVLGTCDRAAVGAVVVRSGRCITWGYNGAPPGMPHCDENYHGWKSWVEDKYREEGRRSWHIDEVKADAEYQLQSGCRNATHAEANALAFAARQGISTDGATLYVTVSPCLDCSRLLIAAGIKTVYYKEEYRDARGLELLRQAGVECWGRPRV